MPFCFLYRIWANYGGSTGLMSSSTDLAKWMLMQLNGGKNEHGAVVIDPSVLAHTHQAQTTIRSSSVETEFHKPKAPFTVSESNYAFGWKVGFYKGMKVVC
jgi:CubicO group peptidase (beta-lactamase class C family)